MSEIDECIERIKGTTQTLVDLLADIDNQRRKEIKALAKRVAAIEHENIRKYKEEE